MLQNFDIQNKKDSEGREIPIPEEHTDGFVMCVAFLSSNYQSESCLLMHKRSHPVPFECSITPRSVGSQNVILEAIGAA